MAHKTLSFLAACSLQLVALTSHGQSRSDIVLVGDGRSTYTIVVPSNADSIDLKAATELQSYLKAISGATLDIKDDRSEMSDKEIIIGNNRHLATLKTKVDFPFLGEDGFHIQTSGDYLIIAGGHRKGTLYAVYTFLDKYLGIRKYTPEIMYIPKRKTITLGKIKDIEIPVFSSRYMSFGFTSNQDYADWHKFHSEADRRRDWGMWVHTFDDLIPEDPYFTSHPEYFSEMGGRRVKNSQLCLSNPDVYRELMLNLDRKIMDKPEAKYWSVSQNDNYNSCRCEECRALSNDLGGESALMIYFVNKVAKEYPDKEISTLAYQYTRLAPGIVKPEPNVNIMLCSIECNRSKPLASDPSSTSFIRDVKAWNDLTDNILLWDYVVQFRNYISPFPNLRVLQPNLKYFADQRIPMMFQQGSGKSACEFYELRQYLIAKLLWDPYADADEIISDFVYGYYGSAAGYYILEYIGMMHDALERSADNLVIYGNPYMAFDSYLSPELIAQYNVLFDQAEDAAAREDSVFLSRVKTARLPLKFAILDISLKNPNPDFSYFRQVGDSWEVKSEMLELLNNFVEETKRAGIERIEEHGTSPDDYSDRVRMFVQKSMNNTLAMNVPVSMAIEPSKKYSQGNAAILTDGLVGILDYNYNWLGFEGTDMSATIDIGEVKSLENIEISFLQQISSWIFIPEKVTISLSSDGSAFEAIETIPAMMPEDRPGPEKEIFKIDLIDKEARYIKVEALSRKTCPAWHIGAGQPCWIFADEIIVR